MHTLRKRKYKSRVIIRVDANSKIGLGHFVRCVALADMIKDEFEIVFAVQNPIDFIKESCIINNYRLIDLPGTPDFTSDAISFLHYLNQKDIVVLDGYHFDMAYQELILTKKCKMVCIDDLHEYHFAANAVINYNPVVKKTDYSMNPGSRLYSGLEYLLLRKEFFKVARESRSIGTTDTCFICMGGADPKNNTSKAIKACIGYGKFRYINVVTGKAYLWRNELVREFSKNKDLIYLHSGLDASGIIDLLKESQLAICPASTIALEAFCVGLNMITGISAENQKDIASFIRNENLALDLGNLNEISSDAIESAIHIAVTEKYFIRQKAIMNSIKPEKIKGIFETLYHEISVDNLI